MAELLSQRDNTLMTPTEKAEFLVGIQREIVSCWSSNTVRRIKPTPEDEARNSFMIIENTLWTTLPAFMRTVNGALDSIGQPALPPETALISFGSWIGGDRDGNPFVTSHTTSEVIKISRWRASELIYKEVDHLLFELSMTHASEELLKKLETIPKGQLGYGHATNLTFAR
jgi:phosphoenolpyruvate carboxylase